MHTEREEWRENGNSRKEPARNKQSKQKTTRTNQHNKTNKTQKTKKQIKKPQIIMCKFDNGF